MIIAGVQMSFKFKKYLSLFVLCIGIAVLITGLFVLSRPETGIFIAQDTLSARTIGDSITAAPRDFWHPAETGHDNITIRLRASSSENRVKILVTGFEEFGGYSMNPSKDLVLFVDSVKPDGFSNHLEVRGIILPVLYNESWNTLHDEIIRYQPDIVLSYGFNPGSDSVLLETTARNYDGGYADNNNVRHRGRIVDDGLPNYHSSLPLIDLERGLNEHGIPVTISENAGSYICNHLFYQLMYHYRNDDSKIAGFIHLPDWKTDDADHKLSRMFNTTITVIENQYNHHGEA